jgi:vacuolar-type H+-ATPase subunit F/Vma7
VSRIAAIGTAEILAGFGLAGALVSVADDPEAVRAAWHDLPADVAVVVLTTEAAQVLSPEVVDQEWPLVAVLP